MTEKLDQSFAPTHDDVQSLNISCNGLLAWKHEVMAKMASFKGKLESLAEKVEEILKKTFSYPLSLFSFVVVL